MSSQDKMYLILQKIPKNVDTFESRIIELETRNSELEINFKILKNQMDILLQRGNWDEPTEQRSNGEKDKFHNGQDSYGDITGFENHFLYLQDHQNVNLVSSGANIPIIELNDSPSSSGEFQGKIPKSEVNDWSYASNYNDLTGGGQRNTYSGHPMTSKNFDMMSNKMNKRRSTRQSAKPKQSAIGVKNHIVPLGRIDSESEQNFISDSLNLLDALNSSKNVGINYRNTLNEANLLNNSLSSRARKYECKICKKKFKYTAHLSIHNRVHTGEKPYECQVCFQSFTQIQSLNRHSRIHTGEKPYGCRFCSKFFTTKDYLEIHTRGHTGHRPYECSECLRKFSSKSALNHHVRHARH